MGNSNLSAIVSGREFQQSACNSAVIGWHPDASVPCKPPVRVDQTDASDHPVGLVEKREIFVNLDLNPLEMKLPRRAVARAADEGLLDATTALKRICQFDVLRWKAEEAERDAKDEMQSNAF